jgi:hypothetical protein
LNPSIVSNGVFIHSRSESRSQVLVPLFVCHRSLLVLPVVDSRLQTVCLPILFWAQDFISRLGLPTPGLLRRCPRCSSRAGFCASGSAAEMFRFPLGYSWSACTSVRLWDFAFPLLSWHKPTVSSAQSASTTVNRALPVFDLLLVTGFRPRISCRSSCCSSSHGFGLRAALLGLPLGQAHRSFCC